MRFPSLETNIVGLESRILMLETGNCSERATYRGNGFYKTGKSLILFPKLETASRQKKWRSSGKRLSNAGKSKT
jgi:hypothetical protein